MGVVVRVVRIASTVAVSALLVGALAGCGSSGTKKSADGASSAAGGGAGAVAGGGLGPKAELLAAAAVMQKVGSAKVHISSDDPSSATGDGDGVYNWSGTPALDLTTTTSGKATRIRLVGGVTYIGVDDQQAALAGGRHWVKVDDTMAGMGASFQAMIVMLDPAVQLTAAAQNGKLSKVGSEPTGEHYRSVTPVDALVAGIPNLKDADRKAVSDALKQDGSDVTTDFWLNAQRQLVQEKEVGSDPSSPSASASGSAPSSTTIKYTDFGVKVAITAPAASDQVAPADAAKLLGGN